MSHLRIWRHNGIIYFAGQVTPLDAIAFREGQFRGVVAADELHALAGDFSDRHDLSRTTRSIGDDAEGR